MFRLPLSLLSPGGARGRLSILIFHRVLSAPDPLFPDVPNAASFEECMRWVSQWFRVLPLGEAVDRLYAGRIPSRAMAITFDDGYADNEQVAAPILQRLGLPATVFVSTGFLGGGCMWNDRVIEAVRSCDQAVLDLDSLGLGRHPIGSHAARRQAIDAVLTAIKHLEPGERLARTQAIVDLAGGRPSPALMMGPEQVQRLPSMGVAIGAHTVTHPILTRLAPEAARQEMLASKRALEAIIGRPVTLFAYPNGVPDRDYAAEHVAMVRECGFEAAVSTAWGAASAESDRFQLPRFTPWDRSRARYGARLVANLTRTEQRAAA